MLLTAPEDTDALEMLLTTTELSVLDGKYDDGDPARGALQASVFQRVMQDSEAGRCITSLDKAARYDFAENRKTCLPVFVTSF